MQKYFTWPVTYFLEEGHANLRQCLGIAFRAAQQQQIKKIIIFTARGEGVRIALEEYCSQEDYNDIDLIAVTFPSGKIFTNPDEKEIKVEITEGDARFFAEKGVPIIKAHLPFNPIRSSYEHNSVLGQDLSLIGEALSMFGGSMRLCVQAITLACDAGVVDLGEHVISLTSDTAILANATSTRRMLKELNIREILCKPAVFTITRRESPPELSEKPESEIKSHQRELTEDADDGKATSK